MNANQRQALINSINRDLGIIQGWLLTSYGAMQSIQARFKEERRSIFHEFRRQTKRSAVTELVLYVHVREFNVLNVPVAEWKHITAKGKSVDNAKATMAARNSGQPRAAPATRRKGQMGTFSNSVPKNGKKNGWRIDHLLSYAHPSEIRLVQDIEAELEPIRKRIRALTATGSRLAQSRFQHLRMLDRPDDQVAAGSSRKKKSPPSLAEKERLAQLEFEAQRSERKPDPPQFRKPI